MSHVTERFDISTNLEKRIESVCQRKGINEAVLVSQASKVAYFVMQETFFERDFYCESVPILLPKAAKLDEAEMAPLEVEIFIGAQEALRLAAHGLGISKQSVLSWGMDCLEMLEEARMWGRIITDGPGGRSFMRLGWLNP